MKEDWGKDARLLEEGDEPTVIPTIYTVSSTPSTNNSRNFLRITGTRCGDDDDDDAGPLPSNNKHKSSKKARVLQPGKFKGCQDILLIKETRIRTVQFVNLFQETLRIGTKEVDYAFLDELQTILSAHLESSIQSCRRQLLRNV